MQEAGLMCTMPAGGVSMGDRDFIKPLLERHGKVHFGKVKMKPGKPLTFATIELDSSRCHPILSPARRISYRTNPMKLVSFPGMRLVLCSQCQLQRCLVLHTMCIHVHLCHRGLMVQATARKRCINMTSHASCLRWAIMRLGPCLMVFLQQTTHVGVWAAWQPG